MAGVLRVWPGDFGLLSFDPDCLQVLTYAKINNYSIKIEFRRLPIWTPIPSYIDLTGRTHTGVLQIENALRMQGDDTDRIYYMNHLVGMEVFKQYVEDELQAATLIIFWNESLEYDSLTRVFFSRVVPFPFNMFFLSRQKNVVEDKLTLLAGQTPLPIFIAMQLEKFDQCLLDLSVRLGKEKYFMGAHPCTLDTIVYSYLAPLYYAPLKNSSYKNKLQDNLKDFVKNMTKVYFPDVKVTYKYVSDPTEQEVSTPVWQVMLATCVAGSALFLFAYTHGIFRVNE